MRIPLVKKAGVGALALLAFTFPACAQEAETVKEVIDYTVSGVPKESAFIFNTFLFLFSGSLVMWMAAGFCMLEAGLVRSGNAAAQCLKNVVAYSVAAILFGFVGYHLMYPGDAWTVNGVIGAFQSVALPGPGATASAETGAYATASDFFYQMAFCATAASIVSGTVAERIKLSAFFAFTVVLTALIYPIAGSWGWGGGFLKQAGFSDFAGSTLVHSVGGWAALTGAIILGARTGRYKNGRVTAMPGSNLPLAALGTFILWLGWLGFNGGSQLALGSLSNASDIGRIFVNTNMAAAAGAVAAFFTSHLLFKKTDLTLVLNGALGGLVMITAEPLFPSFLTAGLLGAIAGVIVVFVIPFMDKLKIDDAVGAIPVHLVCGVLGTLAVPLSNPNTAFGTQLYGVIAVALFVLIASSIVWTLIKLTIGLRVTPEQELAGLDSSELGQSSYPEFTSGK